MRSSCTILINSAYDGTLVNRMMQKMSKVKNLDTVSARGERKVSEGIATPEGKLLFKDFNFNSKSHLGGVLFAPFTLDTATGTVSIPDLIPREMLNAPPHASHVAFKSAFLKIDFETGAYEITYSPDTVRSLDTTVSTVSLVPSAVPTATGVSCYLLLVDFLQEVNGVPYSLNNGNFNSLTMLEMN